MKPKTIIAIAIAAATTMLFISCSWFTAKEKKSSPYEKIAGTWHYEIDTSNDVAMIALLAFIKKDPLKYSFQFTKDSLFYIWNNKQKEDSGRYEIDTTASALYLKNVQGTDTFHVKQLSDSAFILSVHKADSTQIKLTR